MADLKITQLDELTAVQSGDLLAIVDDPSGTPVTKKVTVNNIADAIAGDSTTPVMNYSIFRQAIINGNFDVWQRGASIAMTAANAYTADRWYCETATAGTDKTVSREDGTGVNGSYYCARVKMVGDVDELLTFSQALESQDSIKFRGKKVTLSFYARGGAEFVADNATLVSKIVTGKGTDQKVLAFTTSADGVSQNNTLTTSWVKFTCTTTAAIASDITQIGVSFAFTHAGAGTTTNYFEITQVQLCAGDVALPFMPKSYQQEERDCQRYCHVLTTSVANEIIGFGGAFSTSQLLINVELPVVMRTIPSTLIISNVADFIVSDGVGGADTTGVSLQANSGKKTAILLVTTGAVLTQYRGYSFNSDSTTGRYIGFQSEL